METDLSISPTLAVIRKQAVNNRRKSLGHQLVVWDNVGISYPGSMYVLLWNAADRKSATHFVIGAVTNVYFGRFLAAGG